MRLQGGAGRLQAKGRGLRRGQPPSPLLALALRPLGSEQLSERLRCASMTVVSLCGRRCFSAVSAPC